MEKFVNSPSIYSASFSLIGIFSLYQKFLLFYWLIQSALFELTEKYEKGMHYIDDY